MIADQGGLKLLLVGSIQVILTGCRHNNATQVRPTLTERFGEELFIIPAVGFFPASNLVFISGSAPQRRLP